MRGRREPQATMLAFVDLEERVPHNHPLRVVKRFADALWLSCRPSLTRCMPLVVDHPFRRSGC